MLPFDLSMWLKRAAISLVGAMALLTGLPSLAHAQVCLPVVTHSCLNITFSPNATTPTAADFANGVAVLGSFNVSVLKCGRPPCRITVGAQGQPSGGLRLRVGGPAPVSINECPIDVSGVSSPNASQAPVLAVMNAATTLVVWVCRPLSWDPGTTPIGTTSTEVRFLLRQS
ncbi:hypothetical protein [Gemmatimonas sp.]